MSLAMAGSTLPPRGTLAPSEDDDHQEGVMGLVELEMRLEAVEPLYQLEAACQLHEGAELLREDHARGMTLTVDVALPVLVGLEFHVLEEGLGHRIEVLERLEGGPDGGPSPAARPRPAPRRVGPRRAHVAVENVEATLAHGPGDAAEVGEDGLVREQVALRILHADGGVHGFRQLEAGHIGDMEPDIEPLLGRALAQEGDVLRREVEA